MENRIVAIIGRTASGKDTIAQELEKKMNIGKVIGYTTRSKRTSKEEELETSTNYFFMEEGVFKAKELSGNIIGTFSTKAYNKNGVLEEWHYGYSRDISKGVLVTNPVSLLKLIDILGRDKFVVIQVNAEQESRQQRYMKRDDYSLLKEFERRSLTETEEFNQVSDFDVLKEDGDDINEIVDKIVDTLKSR